MKQAYYLYIETSKGNLVIPFKKIKSLDQLTIDYIDKFNFISNLMNTLDISIDKEEIYDAYIYSPYNNHKLQLKYKSDNYDDDSVKENMIKYFCEDYNRIKNHDIKNVKHPKLQAFLEGTEELNDFDIKNIVNSYFKNNDYRKIRDSYFMLKYLGYKIKINKVKSKPLILKDRSLSNFNSNDEHLSNLLTESKTNPDIYDKIMDEISSYDLEELKQSIEGNYQSIIDGLVEQSKLTNIDIYEIINLSGLTMDELYQIKENFLKNSGRHK